jgi:hypothetical protein
VKYKKVFIIPIALLVISIIILLTVIETDPQSISINGDTGVSAQKQCYCNICMTENLNGSYLISCNTADKAVYKFFNQFKIAPVPQKLSAQYLLSYILYHVTVTHYRDIAISVEIPPPRQIIL